MKKLIFWAAKNRVKAIAIIVLLHVVLIKTALYTGKLLFENEIVLSQTFFYSVIAFFIAIFFFYPVKTRKKGFSKYDLNTKIFKYSYRRHKFLDILSSAAAFLIIIYAGNVSLSGNNFKLLRETGIIAADYKTAPANNKKNLAENYSTKKLKNKIKNFKYSNRKKIRELYKEKIKSKFSVKKKDSLFDWKLVLKIFLIAVLMTAVSFVIAVLSCAILCNGFEVLAILLFSVGIIGLTVLSIYWIKHLIRKKEKSLIEVKSYES